jgi:hypothetical protein
VQRLEQIPLEEMPQVVRLASELYAADEKCEHETCQKQATVQAAAEAGLPEGYMERAAEQWLEQEQARLQQQQAREVHATETRTQKTYHPLVKVILVLLAMVLSLPLIFVLLVLIPLFLSWFAVK